jgi:hypothetical protein
MTRAICAPTACRGGSAAVSPAESLPAEQKWPFRRAIDAIERCRVATRNIRKATPGQHGQPPDFACTLRSILRAAGNCHMAVCNKTGRRPASGDRPPSYGGLCICLSGKKKLPSGTARSPCRLSDNKLRFRATNMLRWPGWAGSPGRLHCGKRLVASWVETDFGRRTAKFLQFRLGPFSIHFSRPKAGLRGSRPGNCNSPVAAGAGHYFSPRRSIAPSNQGIFP